MSETIPGTGLGTAGMTADEKRELLARLLKEKVRCSRPYPMSFAQERLWIIDQFDPGPIYNIPFQIRFPGAVDEAALRKTLSEVVRRHEALRTTFHTENEVSVQRIHPAKPFELPVADLEELLTDIRSLYYDALRGRRGRTITVGKYPMVAISVHNQGADLYCVLQQDIDGEVTSLSFPANEVPAFLNAARAALTRT